ncbi:methyltransferase N6AMT1-like isoform X2 [Uloborus diversus]|uniref:methyltransferase N6AMT1-like isoform X2 n=1 Tax=Uloborus diversus TaxID=327109 RepID=UPI0024099466|nr:methyltransferase N6AMT1-like isoform X2 [Uloborus diversus]
MPSICLEVGSGSGVISATIAKALGPICYLCTDINPVAVHATKILTQSNDVSVDVIQTNLVEAFGTRLKNAVDVLIFNPPYVPSPSEEMNVDNLSLATCGGSKGREVMDRFFPYVSKLISENGVFYLTCISQNNIEDIQKHSSLHKLQMCIVLDRKCGMEHLFVLRFTST